jgi:hypothetical protein
MQPVNIETLITVAAQLDRLGIKYAFTGGSIVGLLLDHPQLAILRPTDDVDAIVEVMTWIDYTKMESRLRDLGFQHDISDGAPLCRWKFDEILVDVMPAHDTSGHFSDRWFQLALDTSILHDLDGHSIRTVNAPCFIATKLAAFIDRGRSDFMASHDMEDIITLVDGRKSLVGETECSSNELRLYVANIFKQFLTQSAFIDALPGHLSPDEASRDRYPIVLQRLKDLTKSPEASQ